MLRTARTESLEARECLGVCLFSGAQMSAKEQGMRCLVIDDDPRDRELVERMVARAGHEAVGATGGPRGLDLAKNETFDVALVDLGMAEMDGVEVLRNLSRTAPDLRLLVVSGFDDKVHVLDA